MTMKKTILIALAALWGLSLAGTGRAGPPRTHRDIERLGPTRELFKDYRDSLWYRQWRSGTPSSRGIGSRRRLRTPTYDDGRGRYVHRRDSRRSGGDLWSVPDWLRSRHTRRVRRPSRPARRRPPFVGFPDYSTWTFVSVWPGGVWFYYIEVD